MGLFGHHVSSGAAAAFALLLDCPALAQSASYSAPPECPPRAWFEAELTARLHGRGASASLWVDIRPAEGGFMGRVEWHDPVLGAVTREVHHESCEQVARALALIGAVLIETSAPPPARLPESVLLPPPPPIERSPPALRPILPPRRPEWKWRTGPSVSFGLMSAVAPIVLAGPRAGWELSADQPGRGYIVALSLGRLRTGRRRYQIAEATLDWYALRLEGCVSWRVTERLGVAACLMTDVGELKGEGFGMFNNFRQKSLWLSPGCAGRGEVRLVGPLAIRIEAGAFFPLWPPNFYFPRPNGSKVAVHRVPAAGLALEAALVARLP